MSFDQAIGAPFTLASLPKPLSSTGGRMHAAGVCSISGIKKRKRTEIVVGLDGEGISVYGLQNPQLVTSYALPPSVVLTSAPYSIYRKGSSKAPSQRFTYASLAGSIAVDSPQIVCFHEKTLGDQSDIVKTSYTHIEDSAQLLSLDSLPVAAGGSAKAATHDIIATFANGNVICLSENLDTVRWVANFSSLISYNGAHFELEHVSLANAKAVNQGFLRSRGDIAAAVNPTSDEASDLLELTQVLCVVGRKADGPRTFALIQIQPRSPDLTSSYSTPFKRLLRVELPRPSKTSAKSKFPPQFALHASSGAIHILVGGELLSYNMAGTVPAITSELSLPGASVDSFLRTSQDVMFTTSRNTCRVFETKFNSLQASLALDLTTISSEIASPSKKRKQAHANSEESAMSQYSLVAYYADIGLVVAAREKEIFGMQFRGISSRKRARTEGAQLIDALGKGTETKSTNTLSHEDQAKWHKRKAKLDRYAEKGEIMKFEEKFAKDLGIELEAPESEKKRENEVNGGPLTNGIGPKIPDEDAMVVDKLEDAPSENELRKWKIDMVQSEPQPQQYRQYALYALGKIFSWSDTSVWSDTGSSNQHSKGSLKVDFFPPNVFEWLLQTGQLTKESIRRSLRDKTPSNVNLVSVISDGDLVKALSEFDPDLHILSAVLNYNHFLPVGEVVQSIKLLVQSIDEGPCDMEATKLLTNGTAAPEDEMDVDIASELEAASEEIDHALSVLDHGLAVRSHALRPALIRLHTFPASVISSTLRTMLPRRDLESLIRLLHLEMKNGGWTSTYDFATSEDPAGEVSVEAPDDHAVTIIASLLSNTLDAIGAGAWVASIGSNSVSETPGEIIASLHSDTSEALNGFWEARYMRGLLSEFLRYASSVPQSHKPSNETLQAQGKPFLVTGKLDGEEDLPMLPLGGKADLGVERTKKSHGGRKEQRSKREMGMLISKKVPKYSFERIVI